MPGLSEGAGRACEGRCVDPSTVGAQPEEEETLTLAGFRSQIRPEDGPTAVESLPVKAVPAQGKVHLFAVGRSCFPEMDK